ncbi:hypothetical protein QBC46DRAFT_390476 [Diplogelasinospora grovesii]|uniref:DNA repair protein rad9 n=1 Tax=Diplogelasinospora grovesii TaxID=303347 RepID=A0AAN6N395_9PEZI|nr:hypothetical protein QBC46DRAFT_390476 [Diplogelasinospora grovesii]
MVLLNFTLSEEGVAVLHDALACIYKFSDDVCMEARKDKLTLTALNISKSAYVCFTFASNRFFSRYKFEGSAQYRERFFCQLYIRSLISVFRVRQGGDPTARDRDPTIERCDVAIDDGPGKKSRLVARIAYRNGITASHSLPFEVKAPTYAKFNKSEAGNRWAIASRTLRQLMDHFGPGIELLDINSDDEACIMNFTCFTEKVTKRGANSNEAVLKKPLHTNIAVDMEEFDDIQVQDKLHIIISVKDFRAILQHAQTTSGELSSCYSEPGRPMKLSYGGDGVLYEFILMTIGEKDASAQKHKSSRSAAQKATRPELEAASRRSSSVANANPNQAQAPPPAVTGDQQQAQDAFRKPSTQRTQIRSRQPRFEIRPSPMPPPATDRSESLFVNQADDDRLWEPVNPDADEEEDLDNGRLEWHTATGSEPPDFRISSFLPPQVEPQSAAPDRAPDEELPDRIPAGLEPTQRLSQVRRFGLFSP